MQAGTPVKLKLIVKVDPVDYCLFPDGRWRSGPEHDMVHVPATTCLTEPWEIIYVDCWDDYLGNLVKVQRTGISQYGLVGHSTVNGPRVDICH